MFESVIEASKRTIAEDAEPDAYDEATGALSNVLTDDEVIRHALISTKGIEHTQNSRKTTIEPGGDHRAVALVTDQRVLVLVGDDSDSPAPDAVFDRKEVTRVECEESLPRSALVVCDDTLAIRRRQQPSAATCWQSSPADSRHPHAVDDPTVGTADYQV